MSENEKASSVRRTMHSRKRRHRLHFLITAGATRERIDPVRFISNASSGKMGYAVARAAVAAGHKVTLISAATSQRSPEGAKVVGVESAGEMFKHVKSSFGWCDCLIMSAAVSDYTPISPSRHKIKKSIGVMMLKLKPTPDILKWAGSHKRREQVVVGFALEDADIRANAERKLREKKLDMIVANTPAAIGSERCGVWVKRAGQKWLRIAKAPKRQIAGRLIKMIEQLERMD